ncbi:MAG: hypothetical protein KAR39_13315 [Thermoplasmata archaeon]|nr:hypothetical protein [Thermoplasmata archaeon]
MDDLYDDINAVERDVAEMSDSEIKRKAVRMFGKDRVEQMTIDEMLQELN